MDLTGNLEIEAELPASWTLYISLTWLKTQYVKQFHLTLKDSLWGTYSYLYPHFIGKQTGAQKDQLALGHMERARGAGFGQSWCSKAPYCSIKTEQAGNPPSISLSVNLTVHISGVLSSGRGRGKTTGVKTESLCLNSASTSWLSRELSEPQFPPY